MQTDTVLQRIAEGHPNYLVELLNDTSFTFLMIDMSPGGDWGRFLGWFFHDLKGTTLKELHVLDLHVCLQDYCSLGAFLSRCSALESLTVQAPVKYFKDRTDGDLWEALPRVHPFALLAHSIATQRPTVIRLRLPTLHYVTFLPHITKALSESQVKHLDLEIPQLPAYFFDNLKLPHLISLTLTIFQPTDFTHLALFLARLPVLDVLRLSFDNYLENWEVTAGLSAFCRSRSFSRVRKLYLHHRFFDPEDGVMLDVDELLGALDSGSGYAGNLHSLHLGNPRERFLVEQESQALPYFLAQLKAPNLRHLSILELVIPLGFGERLAEVIARSPLVSLHVVLSDFDMRAISSQAERYFRGETQDADLTSVLSAIKGSTTLQDVSLYREASVRSHGPAFPGWNSCLHNRDRHRDEWDRLRSRNAALARRTQETAIKALPLARILLCSRPAKRRGRAWPHLPAEILQVIILHATDDPMALSVRQWSRLWRYATDRATISHAAEILRRVQQYDKPNLFDPHCGCGDVYGHAYSFPGTYKGKGKPTPRWLAIADGWLAAHGRDAWEDGRMTYTPAVDQRELSQWGRWYIDPIREYYTFLAPYHQRFCGHYRPDL